MLVITAACPGSEASPTVRSRSSMDRATVVRNGADFQNRSGVGPSLSSVGSNTKWNQRCASWKRPFLLRWMAIVSGTWKNSSQL
ncbi:hypothetical protein [Geodermatophilus amargosae]|uniref:hypothetical protein n=1 Tax=Geodermatophilus amargosae TaxID=1296565 RepID=UPI00111504D4|nr:hypothetical protein [Geodermatophilus amargosae]